MSVLAPIVDYWDGANRRIYLKANVSDFYPIEDIYAEYRNERRVNETFRVWNAFLRAEGNVPKGAGAFTPRYVVLLDGTKIIPFDNTIQINQLGDMITDDPDADASLYDTSSLTVPKVIYIKPSEAETIQLNSAAIEYSSYNGGVTLDVINGISGTEYPIGTPQEPSNNIDDAHTIAESRGFPTIYIIGDLSLTSSTPDLTGHTFIGSGKDRTTLNIHTDASVENCEYIDAHVIGTLDGNSRIQDCVIDNLVYVKGYIEQCVLSPGTIVLAGTEEAHFLDCWSGEPGTGTPIIDMGGTGQALALRNYNGGIRLKNKTGPESVSIDLNSGQIKVDMTTITNGTIVARGVGKLIDDITGNEILSGTYGSLTILNELVSVRNIVMGTWGMHIDEIVDEVSIGYFIYKKLMKTITFLGNS